MSIYKAHFYLDEPRERKCVSIHQMQREPVSSVRNLWRPSRVSFSSQTVSIVDNLKLSVTEWNMMKYQPLLVGP